jgi:high-affinity Fe2+/Pb2+ permease
MKYAIEMGSGAIIYVPSFIKIGSGVQKLDKGGYIHTQTNSYNIVI